MTLALSLLGITVVVLALGGAHHRLSRTASPWAGAAFPVLWAVVVVALALRGDLDSAARYAGVALVFVVLLRMWGEGREARAARPDPAAA